MCRAQSWEVQRPEALSLPPAARELGVELSGEGGRLPHGWVWGTTQRWGGGEGEEYKGISSCLFLYILVFKCFLRSMFCSCKFSNNTEFFFLPGRRGAYL